MMIFIHGQLVISINTSVVKGWSVFMHEKHHFVFNGVGIYKSAYVYSNVVSAPSDTVTGKIVDVQSTHATYINDSRDRAHVNYVLRNPLQKREYGVQRWAKVGAPGLVNFFFLPFPQFACRIHATWCIDFSPSLYVLISAYHGMLRFFHLPDV